MSWHEWEETRMLSVGHTWRCARCGTEMATTVAAPPRPDMKVVMLVHGSWADLGCDEAAAAGTLES